MSYGLGGFFDNVQIAKVARSGAPLYRLPANIGRGRLHRRSSAPSNKTRFNRSGAARYFRASGLQGYDEDTQLEGLFSFIGKAISGIGKGIFGAVKGIGKGVAFVGKNVGKGLYQVGKGAVQVGKFALPIAASAFGLQFGGQQQQQSPIYMPYPTGVTGGGQMPGYPPYFPQQFPPGTPAAPTIFGGPTQPGEPTFIYGGGGGPSGGGGGGGGPLMTTPQGGQVYEGAPPSTDMGSALPLILAGVAAALLLSRR